MGRFAKLEIHKEELSFSAGHFTIFSATDRAPLHGHSYQVSAAFDLLISNNGLSFDYRHYKKQLKALCDELDEHFLLPSNSPYLRIEDQGEYWHVHFNHKILPFLKEDIIILPIKNITMEELSYWFLQRLLTHQEKLEQDGIHGIKVKVYNSPSQSGESTWNL